MSYFYRRSPPFLHFYLTVQILNIQYSPLFYGVFNTKYGKPCSFIHFNGKNRDGIESYGYYKGKFFKKRYC